MRFASPATTVDSFTDQMVNIVTDELDKVAPLKRCALRQLKPIWKWLSDEAIAAKRERRRFEGKWKSTRGESDRIKNRRACRRANRIINESRLVYFHRCFSDCTDSGQECRVAKELLHSSDRDLTRTDATNQTISLCMPFSYVFITKIRIIKNTINSKVSPFLQPTNVPDLPFTGTPIHTFFLSPLPRFLYSTISLPISHLQWTSSSHL